MNKANYNGFVGNNRGKLLAGSKSQSELLGFAIVVLLIAVGMLFVIGFIVLDEKPNNRLTYLQKQVATNLNDALLETTTTCRQLTVRELYLACMDDAQRTICPAVDFNIPQDDKTACNYLEGFISNRLSETLGVLGFDYQYSYRYGAVDAQPQWQNRSSNNLASCESQRSALILSADTKQAIIYLDIFSC